jgi:hypothetical protein
MRYQDVFKKLSNLIYDESTGAMYVIFFDNDGIYESGYWFLFYSTDISGFREAGTLDPKTEWSNINYVLYGLARPPSRTDWEATRTGDNIDQGEAVPMAAGFDLGMRKRTIDNTATLWSHLIATFPPR